MPSARAEDMKSLAALWRNNRKYVFIVAFGVLLYELCEHLPAVGGFLYAFKRAAAPVICGIAAAYILYIPVSFLETKALKRLAAKNRSAARALAMAITYTAVIGAAAAVVVLVAPRIVSAAGMLAESVEGYYSAATRYVEGLLDGFDKSGEAKARLAEAASAMGAKIKAFLPEILPRLLSFTVGAMSAAYGVLLTVVISIYAVYRKERLLAQTKNLCTAILPEKLKEGLFSVCASANGVFRSFIAGQTASCLFVGGLCYVGMRILSMPYPELISAFICLGALIPVVGPWISTVPSAFIILMASRDEPALALWFVIMIIVIQLIDDNIIYPRIVGGAIGLTSIWVLAAVLIGGGLFGIPGLFLAVPVTAVAYRILGDWTNGKCRA